jgi:hypothetical protein
VTRAPGARTRLVPGAARKRCAIVAGSLLAAGAFLLLEPRQGPTVLALSEEHGIDAADLPAFVLVVLAIAVA